jgi:hypothetical protein
MVLCVHDQKRVCARRTHGMSVQLKWHAGLCFCRVVVPAGGWQNQWAGGANKFVKFVLHKENMDTQVGTFVYRQAYACTLGLLRYWVVTIPIAPTHALMRQSCSQQVCLCCHSQ